MIYRGAVDGQKFENLRWYEDDPDYCKRVADKAVRYFTKYLTHTKGRWAGLPFIPLEWQEHRIIRPLFGLLKEKPSKALKDGIRRINKVYCEVPKKQGKSETVAGIETKLLRADHEMGAEVYVAACDREQATIIHSVAAQMIRNNDELKQGIKIRDSVKRIIFEKTGSYAQALSSEVPTKHGLNSHAVLFDELHAQPNADLWNILTEGSTVARTQPLIFAITTAGFDRHSICYKQREYALRVLNGVVDDPAFLPIIYGMDEDDDWENEDNWRAVNPSMDTIFSFESFKKDFLEAKEMPHKQNLFRRLRLNQWTRQETRYLPMDKWLACPRRPGIEELRGELCFMGLDLATVMDVAALELLFPPSETRPFWDVVSYFFVPEQAIDVRCRRDRVPYDQWVRDGYMTTTPGNAIDYSVIEAKILECAGVYKVANLGYDRAFAIQIIQNMDAAGIETVPVGMGWLSMAAPMKELLRLVITGQLRHGHNPVLDWMAENLAVKTDPAGNVKPAKDASSEKIDGIVALCCALFPAIGAVKEEPSYYETHDIWGHDVTAPAIDESNVVPIPVQVDDRSAAIARRYGG